MNIFTHIKTPNGQALRVFGLWLYHRGDAMEGYFHPSSTVVNISHDTVHIKTKNKTVYINLIDRICGSLIEKDIPIGPTEEIITSTGKFLVQPAQRVHARKRFIAPVVNPNKFYFVHEYPVPLKTSYNPKVWAVQADTAVEATLKLYECDLMLHELGEIFGRTE